MKSPTFFNPKPKPHARPTGNELHATLPMALTDVARGTWRGGGEGAGNNEGYEGLGLQSEGLRVYAIGVHRVSCGFRV